MKKTIRTVALLIAISLPFFISSCMETIDEPARTAETEQLELNQAIANLEKAGYNIDTTDLGVFYIMDKQGTGPLPQAGDTCFLIYTGFFLNGAIFDSSGDYYLDSIYQFNYLEVNFITGFNDGIALLNKGAEAEIIVPSNLAYGATGYGAIPPFTPLVFSMKMRDLKPVQ
jgi:FKBP-type peptidyl-prolyl cis-trans isomerase FkpA